MLRYPQAPEIPLRCGSKLYPLVGTSVDLVARLARPHLDRRLALSRKTEGTRRTSTGCSVVGV